VASLTVALLQVASGLDPAENRDALDPLLDRVVADGQRPRPRLVLLPEAYARDFGAPGSDVAAFAEPLDGPFVIRLTELAARHDLVVVAGMFEVSDDPERPFNTLVAVGPEGLRASYRKIHLYDSFGYRESDRLLAGRAEPVVVDVDGIAVGLMTCYDLRFPEMSRALVDAGAEVLLVPAAWVAGERKVAHWRTLVTARAVENTVYVVAAGQPAPRYTGHSMIVAPHGDVLAELGPDEDGAVLTATLESDLLAEVRAANPSLANRRL
jgi:predicted amidohydrolase